MQEFFPHQHKMTVLEVEDLVMGPLCLWPKLGAHLQLENIRNNPTLNIWSKEDADS